MTLNAPLTCGKIKASKSFPAMLAVADSIVEKSLII